MKNAKPTQAEGWHAWVKPHREATDEDIAKKRWAGQGHVGAFLFQFACVLLVQAAVWGFFLLWAMKMSH